MQIVISQLCLFVWREKIKHTSHMLFSSVPELSHENLAKEHEQGEGEPTKMIWREW